LSVFTDSDIKTAFTRKDAGLLLHRVIVAVQFVLTHAEVGRAAARHRHADTAAPSAVSPQALRRQG
ncbi:hypothetical protein, partial [Yersinia enterocolitica]